MYSENHASPDPIKTKKENVNLKQVSEGTDLIPLKIGSMLSFTVYLFELVHD